MDELIAGVGSVDKAAALKALLTWVDLGVLKEDGEGTFRLLEVAEEPSPADSSYTRAGQFLSGSEFEDITFIDFVNYSFLQHSGFGCAGSSSCFECAAAAGGADEGILEGRSICLFFYFEHFFKVHLWYSSLKGCLRIWERCL